MKVLILGGTQFIGRHIAETLLAAGHTVSVLTRGQSPDPLPVEVERLRGDRDAGEAGLVALGRTHTWDACIDTCGYTPAQVRPSATLLKDRIGRYVFISAVRVYGDPTERPVTEEHPCVPPAPDGTTELDDNTYGPLKVACEAVVRAVFDQRATILRPQVVAGPHDPSERYTYWAERALRPEPLLAPGDGTDHVQLIDVRDVARFAQMVLESDLSGTFNLAGPRLTWAEFLTILGAKNPIWTPPAQFPPLPLYRPEHGRLASLMDVSSARAQAAGLTLTPPERTARDIQDRLIR